MLLRGIFVDICFAVTAQENPPRARLACEHKEIEIPPCKTDLDSVHMASRGESRRMNSSHLVEYP